MPDNIRSNIRIGRIASEKACQSNAPVFTQLDVSVEKGILVKHIDEDPQNPPSTLRIATEALRWAKEREFEELWIAAAKPHLPRILRDIKKMSRKLRFTIKISLCEGIEAHPEDSWFCLNSRQEHTRSKEAWEKRESVLMRLPFFLYRWIVRLAEGT